MQKSRKPISIFAAVAMILLMLVMTVNAETTSLTGSGTETDPYLITSVDDLIFFRDNVSSGNSYRGEYVQLKNDINLKDIAWEPIGKSSSKSFEGTFDGNNKTISNLTVKPNANYGEYGYGFFGSIASAKIKNLNMLNANIDTLSAGNVVGAITGYAFGNPVFENVHVRKSTINGYGKIGGIIGMNDESQNTTTFINCSVENSTINGGYDAAGIMGLVMGKVILTDTSSINNTFKPTEPSDQYIELDTTVAGCNESAATCVKNGTKVKGLYYAKKYDNILYAYAAYADLYVKYGDSNHDCKLDGASTILLANSELAHNIPSLENGSGTETDPYIINNADDLKAFRDSVNFGNNYAGKFVKLAADIDLQNEIWDPIGKGNNGNITFKGTFDGNGKTISNYRSTYTLIAESNNTNYEKIYTYFGSALFGRINSAIIKNLSVTNASNYVNGEKTIANITSAVCGYSFGNSTFEKVNVTNCTISGSGKVGAIVGMSSGKDSNITLTDCTVDNVTLKGMYNVAGLVANMQGNITLSGCKVSGITFKKTESESKYIELDTTVAGCNESAATCAKNGTKVKGLYFANKYGKISYAYAAYADLYIKYGDSNHDCKLDGTSTILLANSEITNNLPSVEISDADAYIDKNGNGNLRFISKVSVPANTTVTTFGTWLIPENIFDSADSKKLTIEKNNDLSGDSFAADLMEIPSTELDRKILGVSYIETEYGSTSSASKTATVNDYAAKQ